MTTRKFWTVLLVAALGFALIGCSGEKPADTATGEKPTADSTSADPGATKPDEAKQPENKTEDGKTAKAAVNTAKPPIKDAPKAIPVEDYKAKPASGDPGKFVGTYTLAMSPNEKKLMEALKKKGKPGFAGKITIKADGSYEFAFGPEGKERVTKGTTQASGDKITLTPSTVDGKTPSKAGDQRAMEMKLEADGKTLALTDGGRTKFTKS